MLGAKSMVIDFGEDVGQCVLGTVNSSAKSVMERSGAGRIGHLHCVMPWLQERVGSGEMRTWNERESRTGQTGTQAATATVLRTFLENVEDEMARWTSSAGVECGASALTA